MRNTEKTPDPFWSLFIATVLQRGRDPLSEAGCTPRDLEEGTANISMVRRPTALQRLARKLSLREASGHEDLLAGSEEADARRRGLRHHAQEEGCAASVRGVCGDAQA